MILSKETVFLLTISLLGATCVTLGTDLATAEETTKIVIDESPKAESEESPKSFVEPQKIRKPKPLSNEKLLKKTNSQDRKNLSNKRKASLLKKIKILEAKRKKDPKNMKIIFTLGVLHHRAGNLDKSIVYLKKTNEEPKVPYLKYLAKVLHEKGDHLEEVRALGILLTLRPKSPNVNTDIGKAYFKIGKTDEAIEHYRQAIKTYKKHRPAWEGLLEVFRSQENAYEMRLLLTDMIKIFRKDVYPLTELCELDLQESFFEAAVQTCGKAIELDSSVAANHVFLGLAYKFQKNDLQADKIIVSAANRFKDSEFAQYEAGQINEGKQNWEAARKFYLDGIRAYNKSARCHLGAARSFLELKQYENSLKFYLRACKLDRGSYDELLAAIGKLRSKDVDKWYSKFRSARDKCGI